MSPAKLSGEPNCKKFRVPYCLDDVGNFKEDFRKYLQINRGRQEKQEHANGRMSPLMFDHATASGAAPPVSPTVPTTYRRHAPLINESVLNVRVRLQPKPKTSSPFFKGWATLLMKTWASQGEALLLGWVHWINQKIVKYFHQNHRKKSLRRSPWCLHSNYT